MLRDVEAASVVTERAAKGAATRAERRGAALGTARATLDNIIVMISCLGKVL